MNQSQNSMKIWYIVAVSALLLVCIICMILGLTLSGDKYYNLTYDEFDGVSFIGEISSGAKVKDGTVVKFAISIDANKVTGDPVVKTNDQFTLTPDENGLYSFTMKRDTVVKVENIIRLSAFDVTFDGASTHTRFICEQGDTNGPITVSAGESISFKVVRSVYCVGDPVVLANTTIVEPDEQGVYTFAVTQKTNVTVTGIETEEPFYRRENCGDGSRTNPYKLSRPIDLYSLADLVSNGFYVNVKFAYYELTADIDLNGEQLYIIGDATTENSLFAGHFNGNGHTVSNFFIEDYIIEQSGFTVVKLPYVGMFGYVTSSVYGPAEISNLHIKDFTINVDRIDSAKNQTCCIGGLAGYVGGANITGCSASGVITANASDEELSYIGGAVGVVESISVDGVGDFSAILRSCSSEMEIIGEYGYIYGGGGIAGYAKSAFEKNPCVILNCYSTGSIEGAINAGGIVGRCAEYSSVLNCYSTGDISAISYVPDGNLSYAYGGGIVGYLETGGIVANSFARGGVFAESVAVGADKAVTGDIIGGAQLSANSNLHDANAYEYNCYSKGVTLNNQFYRSVLGWEESDWVFGDGEYPLINFEDSTITYNVNVNFIEKKQDGAVENNAYSITATDVYMPMAFWHYQSEGLPEFYNWKGLRSYGYYFDKELTMKVPYSFVPTGDITLYAGFADYTEVEGRYYVKMKDAGSGVYIELSSDGILTMRDGARSYVSFYTYDGELIRLYDNALLSSMFFEPQYLMSFVGTIEQTYGGKELVAFNKISYEQGVALYGAKELDGFGYGVYYDGDSSFVFNTDGSVVIKGTSGYDGTFAYYPSVDGDSLVILRSNDEADNISVTLSDGKVSSIQGIVSGLNHIDVFKGTWEKPVAAHMQYTFDGKGVWSYEYFGYDAAGNKVPVTFAVSGTYEVNSDGVAIMYKDGSEYARAMFENGTLKINGESYFNSDSFAGLWLFNSKSPIEVRLDGIDKNGFGTAAVNYGGKVGVLEANYSFDGEKLYLFNGLSQLGELAYSYETKTLDGKLLVISPDGISSSQKNIRLCLYDSFKGVWVSDDSVLSLVEFNGLGNYDIKGTADYLAISGNIRINGVSVGAYSVTNGTLSGSFEYDSVTYNISYDLKNNRIVVNESIYLVERDELYGLELLDADGNKYVFDGKGYVNGGGTLSVNGAEDYTYLIQSGNVVITGAQSGSMSLDEFILTLGSADAKHLFLNGDFEGSWIVGGTENGIITLGKVGANASMTGTFMGNNVVFSYDKSRKTLSFDWNGVTATVEAHKLESENITELSVKVGATTYICMDADNTYFDEYKGTYTGKNSTIVLDGFLNSRFGGATALIIQNNGDVYSIPYQIDRFGQIVFIREGVTYDILLENPDGEYVGESGGKSYDLCKPDSMYRRSVYGLKDNHEEIDENTIYYFDGVGGVYDKNTKLIYKYEIQKQTDQDILDLVLRAVFTDVKRGKKYNVVIDYGSTDYTLYMTEIITAEE